MIAVVVMVLFVSTVVGWLAVFDLRIQLRDAHRANGHLIDQVTRLEQAVQAVDVDTRPPTWLGPLPMPADLDAVEASMRLPQRRPTGPGLGPDEAAAFAAITADLTDLDRLTEEPPC